MSNAVKAANLPDGSVVANDNQAFIKIRTNLSPQWRGTNGVQADNAYIDAQLVKGAVVLREGH